MRTIEHDGFRDDGGTRAWRANQDTWGADKPPSFRRRVAAVPFWKVCLFLLGWAFLGPMLALIFGLILAIGLGVKDSPGNAMLIAGLDLAFVVLAFGAAVRRKLGYVPRKGK